MRVLVVDDSIVFRSAIRTALQSDPNIEKVETASNGRIGVEFVRSGKFDAVTLDLEMPEMDGMAAVKAIREFNKEIVIIIFSSQTRSSAGKTMDAITEGANDFIPKFAKSGQDPQDNIQQIKTMLLPRLHALCQSGQKGGMRLEAKKVGKPKVVQAVAEGIVPEIICIGSSTGGPETLKCILRDLAPSFQTPILLVQHMPPVFTTQFAALLDRLCPLTVKEAQNGEQIQKGHVYLAPGDFHMKVYRDGEKKYISLTQEEKVCYVRPAVDVLLKSVAKELKGPCLTYILTGMGEDGARGCSQIRSAGGKVVIQDQETSIVWGMPGAVHQANQYDAILPLTDIAKSLNKAVGTEN